jgi:glycosyltransferase involved in cell wall biosynthesis
MRSLAHTELGFALLRNHRRRPYDCIFQFAQTELFALGWLKRYLPPIVVHPCTSAARELYWHRRERDYALQTESRTFHYTMRAFLIFRARVQRRELSKPDLLVGPSDVFNKLLAIDYGISPHIIRTLRHPVDPGRYEVSSREHNRRPLTLLFASRLSSRKGLELVVGLSHRLVDLQDRVDMKVVGDRTMWSDYSAHIKSLHPSVAHYGGSVGSSQMPALYRESDIVLVPSHFEPGSLVVGEALASGLPVVASDQVGPVEVLDRAVCRTFRFGDLDDFEMTVRALVDELENGAAGRLAERARHEAVNKFAPPVLGARLLEILEEASALR